jgi:parallel beta-helix repeat protein
MRWSSRIAGPGRGRVLLGGLLVSLSLVAPVPGAHADQLACGQVITASTTLTNSLSGCAGDGVVIGASGVTLDLNGQTISGVGLGAGVRNDGHDDVTIRNGTVAQFDYGIVLGPGTLRGAVTGNNLQQNEWSSIHLDDAHGSQVRQNSVSEAGHVAVRVANGSSSNLLAGNTVAGGNGEAFLVESGSDSNRLEANVVTDSSNAAMRVDSSPRTTIIGNLIGGGSDVAITMSAAPGSVVQSNHVGTVGDAAVLVSDATTTVVRFNVFGHSADAGVILSTVSDSLVKANTMTESGDSGILLRAGSNGNRVIDNQAAGSSDAGIFLADGEGNVVRGNTLWANTAGIEASGGRLNRLEWNAADANLGVGIEITGSTDNTLLGNTATSNLGGGIWIDGAATGNNLTGNAASGNHADGLHVSGAGTVVTSNLATDNLGWGIYTTPGVIDGGGNGARGNTEAAQCYLIACSDGAGWQAPVRPPEPLDPLEIGLDNPYGTPHSAAQSPAPQGTGRRGLRARRARLAVVNCKRRRPARGQRRRGARGRAKVVCRARYRADRTSRRLAGRLIRDDKSFARGTRKVRAGRPGSLAMRARKHPRAGRYTLQLTFRDARGRPTVVRKAVWVR